MLEIFALPYILATGIIGWAIYEPFFRTHEFESPPLAQVAIADLLAVSLQIAVFFTCVKWLTPIDELSLWGWGIVLLSALVFAVTSLVAGLFLVPRAAQMTFLKRMVIIVVIAPFGITLTIGWVGILSWACFYSVMYLAPAMFIVAAAMFGLRKLTLWVCDSGPDETYA